MSQGVSAVRILLLGEPRVGKTTLILSLVSEEFSPKVPAHAEEITIPEDVTPEHIPTQIVDYSAQTQSHEHLCAEIKRANVICLVHALDDENSFKQISSYWLPLIRHVSTDADTHIPIVIVGNKLDINHESKLNKMLPLMSEYCEVETCIECSAKTMLNLSETFWFAQKAVLYPTAPLYNAEKKECIPVYPCSNKNISNMTDNDGYLSDRELEAFQTRCFSIPLTAQSLHDVKQLVKQSCPGGVTVNGLTQKGFLFLHLMFIQKGRHETTWTVLRRFGYGNHMRLSEQFIYPKFSIASGCSTEISPVGIQFLNALFNKYDLSGSLWPSIVNGDYNQYDSVALTGNKQTNTNMSSLTSPSVIHKTSGLTGSQLFASHRSDLSKTSGSMTVANEALLRAIIITNDRRIDAIRRSTQRTVFYCRVYGARKVGKTCLMQGLLGRSLAGSGGTGIGGITGRTSNWVASSGVPVYGQSRTLLMHEISASAGEQMSANEALAVDVACLVYDVSDAESFRYVANIFLNFYRGTRVPCLFVAAKSDQSHVIQNYQIDPSEMITKYHLPPIESFSSVYLLPKRKHYLPLNNSFSDLSNAATATTTTSNGNGLDDTNTTTLSTRRRAGSADPISRSSLTSNTLTNNLNQPLLNSHDSASLENSLNDICDNSYSVTNGSRSRHHSRSDLYNNTNRNLKSQSEPDFRSVYILLCTMANYPHYRGFELAQTDHTWKWTLAATVLAGFGFFAFQMAKTHL
ncbi:LOW QUALITY PROTEIN: putative rac-GTP binding protein [Schistosoma mansoni]|uniref:putative rac-GTP binding protein n=1 Tax=Schistosoma mansoni TaxID=6183 RepID=UPI00022DC253|nr:LOW QUALITY PROTEIN: putative rac-GTP binding protein [Schistosoma mansoni]|eukprot:XP_018653316.1 LOW QUALITY PROTEIN: putative rac-GTP binding protein [Schistosoma mansoni]